MGFVPLWSVQFAQAVESVDLLRSGAAPEGQDATQGEVGLAVVACVLVGGAIPEGLEFVPVSGPVRPLQDLLV